MKKVLTYFALLCLALTSCSKDEVDSLEMKIEGTVYDTQTSGPLADATISITTNGSTDSTNTDENGFYSLGNYTTGEYIIYVSKDNYLTTSTTVSSSDLTVTDNTETVVTSTTSYLVPMNQSANVTVYKYNEDANSDVTLAAANVPFTVYIDALNQFTDTTTSEGMISLDNLPYDTEVKLIFDFELDGVTYYKSSWYSDLSDYTSITVYGSETTTSTGDFGFVSTSITDNSGEGVDDFSVSDAVVLNFTQAVDTTSNSYFYLEMDNYPYTDVEYSLNWSNNNKTLTITPTSNLEADTDYYFYGRFYNESDDDYIYGRITFSTEAAE